MFPQFMYHTLSIILTQGGEPAPPDFAGFVSWALATVLTLGGLAALLTMITNTAKQFKLIPDGKAPKIITAGNLIAFIALIVLRIFRPELISQYLGIFDSTAAAIAQAGTVILAFVVQLVASRKTHEGIRGMPIIGTSYTMRDIKDISPTPTFRV